jgi:anti-anti-sigma factor
VLVPSPRPEGTTDDPIVRHRPDCSRSILRLTGELDIATAASVRTAVDDACRDTFGEVVLDLSHVQFFDAITLGIFAQASDRLNKAGGHLTLKGLSPHQEKVVRIYEGVRRSYGESSLAC